MNSNQEGSLVFGPLTNHRAVAVKCILGCHRYSQGAVLKTNHGGCQGASIISRKKKHHRFTLKHYLLQDTFKILHETNNQSLFPPNL